MATLEALNQVLILKLINWCTGDCFFIITLNIIVCVSVYFKIKEKIFFKMKVIISS